MGIYSPGSACILHRWGTEPNLGLVAKTTMGTDHVCGLVVLQGQSRARVNAGMRLAMATEYCACRDAVAQGSAAAAVGSGGSTGSGGTGRAGLSSNGHKRVTAGTGGLAGQKNRWTRRLRARFTGQARRTADVESRAREGLTAGEGLEGI